jgi:hypothetical protein
VYIALKSDIVASATRQGVVLFEVALWTTGAAATLTSCETGATAPLFNVIVGAP